MPAMLCAVYAIASKRNRLCQSLQLTLLVHCKIRLPEPFGCIKALLLDLAMLPEEAVRTNYPNWYLQYLNFENSL